MVNIKTQSVWTFRRGEENLFLPPGIETRIVQPVAHLSDQE